MLYVDPAVTDESISTAVTHALDAAEITFSIHPTHAIEPALRVHAILLQHLDQQRLVLIPRNHILDLVQLNTLTGNSWHALSTPPPFSQSLPYGNTACYAGIIQHAMLICVISINATHGVY